MLRISNKAQYNFVRAQAGARLKAVSCQILQRGRMITLRSAHTEGLVPATSPGDQVPSCELPIFTRKSSRRDQNLVPATCPTNSNMV